MQWRPWRPRTLGRRPWRPRTLGRRPWRPRTLGRPPWRPRTLGRRPCRRPEGRCLSRPLRRPRAKRWNWGWLPPYALCCLGVRCELLFQPLVGAKCQVLYQVLVGSRCGPLFRVLACLGARRELLFQVFVVAGMGLHVPEEIVVIDGVLARDAQMLFRRERRELAMRIDQLPRRPEDPQVRWRRLSRLRRPRRPRIQVRRRQSRLHRPSAWHPIHNCPRWHGARPARRAARHVPSPTRSSGKCYRSMVSPTMSRVAGVRCRVMSCMCRVLSWSIAHCRLLRRVCLLSALNVRSRCVVRMCVCVRVRDVCVCARVRDVRVGIHALVT